MDKIKKNFGFGCMRFPMLEEEGHPIDEVKAKEIIDYAHEYGIQMIWGYAWGWSPRACADFRVADLQKIKEGVLEKFEREYAPLGVDGIYFQSFTELHDTHIGGKMIAETVVDGYKKIESGVVEGFEKVTDKCVEVMFTKKGVILW